MKARIVQWSSVSLTASPTAVLIALSFIALPSARAEITLPVLAEAGSRRDADVSEVRSVRRYILHNDRWSDDAMAEVLFVLRGNNEASYSILSTTARGLHREVLRRILDGEVDAWKKRDAEITPANYDAKPIGMRVVNGQNCEALELSPKGKSRFVLEGWLCGDPHDSAITHIEGTTAKSVSFWVGKVHISQDFRKIGPYWYSSVSRSTADVRFFGKTQLTISYLDYEITPKKGTALLACRSTGCSPALRAASEAAYLKVSADHKPDTETVAEITTLPPAASPVRSLH